MKQASGKKKTPGAASSRKPVAKAKSRAAAAKSAVATKSKAKAKPQVKAKPARRAPATTKAPAKAAAKRTPARVVAKAKPNAKASAGASIAQGLRRAGGAAKSRASATLLQAAPKRSNAPVSRSAGAKPKLTPADTRSTEGLDGALAALKLALEKKAVEPTLLDLRDLCSYTNYRLLLSGRSDRQVDAIADGVVAGLRDAGVRHLSKERTDARAWTLIDFGDFIVDVFHHPSREHYDLESLWNDAPRVAIEVPPDARLSAAEAYA